MENNIFTTQMLDIITQGDDVFVVLEHMSNNLKHLGDLRNDIKEKHIVVIIYNLLCAINFIHKTGLVHMNLKPSNILIDKFCKIKICGFEMAKTLVENELDSKI